MSVAFVDLRAHHAPIKEKIDQAIADVVQSGQFILGPQVEEFERNFAAFVGARHGVGVGNGGDALRLALMALGIGTGDEVILPANTYIATALAVSAVGATPVLVDCVPCTYNIDASLIERSITAKTKAIMPVHLTGQAADMDGVMEVAQRHGLPVVEDAAQAHGATWRGRPCGSIGVMGCFSFYPSKNLGAYGDAGMITTSDPQLAERLCRLRDYGQQRKYEHTERGLNSRLDTLQAAVLSVKLPYLPTWNAARVTRAEKYREVLRGIGDLEFQETASGATHVYHLFMIESAHRDPLRVHLSGAKIHTGVHYPIPIHLQRAYSDAGYSGGNFPHTERLATRLLSLPMFPELRDDQIVIVAEHIRAFFDTTEGQGRGRSTDESGDRTRDSLRV